MTPSARNSWICVFSVFTLFCAVKGAPLEQYSVDLNTCQPSISDVVLSGQCLSVCEPVRTAQEICEQGLPCTCDIASPGVIMACLECQYTAQQEESGMTAASRRALSAYAELCGILPETRQEEEAPSHDDAAPSDLLARRERLQGSSLACEYGVPALSLNLPPAFIPINPDHRIFGFLLLSVAIALCIVDRQWRRSTD
ncbi:uncharacterized protein PHACADRAFT_186664 [Phanerochaete carnosa HHB-10118-sp]|uniref:Extracellular membrane protein CFEM domain-containing protein n=1 Tax=Phanerochaete carnosa (strain HHB-10118-sp) TaxID=650164 RepID=K5W0A7_PHACS|nr:uncharacterized protein PHACADRAFT_186664 [Phanerochaete carnosa HHB-10118-sp]EKM52530.1 hypothetical protein PHACADRAFT_186664 [Phanerochaete carnosa HHB-10118-sp]